MMPDVPVAVCLHRSDPALAARPRLSRERMIDEYRLAIESLAVRVPLAA